jgi:dihydrofolate reductase
MNIDSTETGLEDFFRSIDGLVMGRRTYDFVFNYGSWPYEDKPTWVCTHSDLQPLEGANLIGVGDIEDVVSDAATRGIEHLWLVGGGRLATSFLAKGLITNLSISEMPIKLESGIPLFSDHKLDDIAVEQRNVIHQDGFRKIEIVIRRNQGLTST